MNTAGSKHEPDDETIFRATQGGIPLSPHPFRDLAERLGCDEAWLLERFRQYKSSGQMRRMAVVPNHYRIGYRANGMSVWNLPPEKVGELGRRIGALDFVSHCYERPLIPGRWEYNLFAMVHGHDRSEVEEKVREIRELLAGDYLDHTVLYSEKILKKTGLRFRTDR